jgi:thiamine-monophosphate kinase
LLYPLPVLNPESTVAEVGEAGLVRHLQNRIPGGPGVVLGVGDDAAVVETSALTMVTTDSLVEDVHFRREWAVPRLLGRKALSINLSDVAAMAGIPRYALVSLCLPPETRLAFVDGFYDGLLERAAETGVNVVGGNLARTAGPAVISLTLVGQAPRILGRAGALPGDLVVVTGMLGGAAAGLKLLAQGARLDDEGELASTGVWTESSAPALRHCLRAQLDPQPPLSLARALAEVELVHAAIDLSDGLSGDLRRLCEASGVAATIDAFAVPVNPHAAGLERARGGDALALALHGGEDYQLLLATAPESLMALRDLAVIWDLPLAVVGEFVQGEPEVYLGAGTDRVPLAASAHDHFRAALAAGARSE